MKDRIVIPDVESIGPALRAERLEQGISQRKMAIALGTDGQRITEWEGGRKVPHAGTLLKLANALGYDLALIPRETE